MLKPRIDIRRIILDRLKQIGKSVYWFSREQSTLHPVSCRQYFYGARKETGKRMNPSTEFLEDCFHVLGLTVVPLNELKTLRANQNSRGGTRHRATQTRKKRIRKAKGVKP